MWAAGLLPHFKTAKVPRDAIVMLTRAGLLPQPQAEGYATLDFRVDISYTSGCYAGSPGFLT